MIKPTVSPIKNARGRITGYRAIFADMETTADTKDAAIAKLRAYIEALCTASANYIDTFFDGKETSYTIMVYRTHYAWSYRYVEVRKDYYHTSCEIDVSTDRRTAIASALNHVAQNMYAPDTRDRCEAMLAGYPDTLRDFQSWADWQERYQIIKAKGYGDECHTMACHTRTQAEAEALPAKEITLCQS